MSEERVGHVSRRDATIACVVSAMLAAVLMSVVLIGSDIPLKCIDGGSVADWAAAFGTWVIGYGAWRIAKDSHQHRIDEYQAAVKEKREERRVRIWRMRDAAVNATVLHDQVARFSEKEDGERRVWQLRLMLSVAHTILSKIVWTDGDRSILPQESVEALGQLEFEILHNLDMAKTFIERSIPDAIANAPVSEAQLEPYLHASKSLLDRAEEFLALLDELPD